MRRTKAQAASCCTFACGGEIFRWWLPNCYSTHELTHNGFFSTPPQSHRTKHPTSPEIPSANRLLCLSPPLLLPLVLIPTVHPGSRSGDVTPGTSRPGSAMSTSTSVSGVLYRRSTGSSSATPRKPRPASIAGTGMSIDSLSTTPCVPSSPTAPTITKPFDSICVAVCCGRQTVDLTVNVFSFV